MDEMQFIEVEGQTVNLAELAGLDISTVADKRQVRFPIGKYMWEITADPEPPKLQKINDKSAGFPFNLKCIGIIKVKDPSEAPDGKPENLIGCMFRAVFFLNAKDLIGSLGYTTAFLHDVGVQGAGPINQKCVESVGLKFIAGITHTKNKDDKDAPPYINLDTSSVVGAHKMAA